MRGITDFFINFSAQVSYLIPKIVLRNQDKHTVGKTSIIDQKTTNALVKFLKTIKTEDLSVQSSKPQGIKIVWLMQSLILRDKKSKSMIISAGF